MTLTGVVMNVKMSIMSKISAHGKGGDMIHLLNYSLDYVRNTANVDRCNKKRYNVEDNNFDDSLIIT